MFLGTAFTLFTTAAALAADPPREWIDPDTGHRVIRLSDEPGSGSLYFNQNAYTPDGKRLLFTSPTGLYTFNLDTRKIDQIVDGPVRVIIAGHKTGNVYFARDNTVFAVDVDTHAVRKIAALPFRIGVSTINADETLLAGAMEDQPATRPSQDDFAPGPPDGRTRRFVANGPDGKPLNSADAKEVMLDRRLSRHIPMCLFTIDVRTGKLNTFDHCTDWLNHVQASPTDPNLLLFCHEGPWHKVDRVWTINADGTNMTLIHHRTMLMEIAGHEFFGADGKSVWYDLQTPRGEDFWVAGYELATGLRTWYHLQRDEWSVHFNVSPDGKLFAGDGGDSEMVAHAKDGKWIYLFHPTLTPNIAGLKPDQANLIQSGVFHSERLVNMSRHDYHLEPNVTFTPDMKWIVFRSNMFGPEYVFAVEIAKTN